MHSLQRRPATPEGRFVARRTRWTRPPGCPELSLGLAGDPEALWSRQETALGTGHPYPYWAIAWPAGQGLARTLLDAPPLVAGKTVLDLGAGSGIAAIAAALAGARRVVACDSDPFALESIARNARRNAVTVETTGVDPMREAGPWDVVLAADLWYEPFFARKATAWLLLQAGLGRRVLLADSGRAHAPRRSAPPLAIRTVPASTRLEPAPEVTVTVWQMGAGAAVPGEVAH